MLIRTNLPSQNDIDQAWAKEVERRCQEVDDGTAKLIPGEEVFEKIEKRFAKCDTGSMRRRKKSFLLQLDIMKNVVPGIPIQ